MRRLLILTTSILYTSFTLAKSSYQVDLIIFSQPQNGAKTSALDLNIPLIPINKNAIVLKSSSNKSSNSYNLLPVSQSGLSNENYLLRHKSRYHVIGHYSWRQPANSQSTVALQNNNNDGWQVQGTIKITQSNYYMFNADLQFSPPGNPQGSFAVSQKQRLKGNVVYYLDHPQIGILVKVH